ncbi:hypothetical protein E5676_scaffold143G001050 [Cucumis melo var. makuwa]|uniref:Ubiquitin-like protease family profile domain-containing protein n=1 Tax=Cucumis melo var. makuwa TaxID=1194695 RepID=A0A5D3BYY0_CUCMM|nr:hypothetical protein E5676_scaffold143G001050 [Cucumis melo var. makuwa]
MFKNLENAKNLRWHAMDRNVDGIMRHPADTPSWRLIDHMWPTFGSEPRNLRLDPKQPGYDINTYLAPLIDDLKILWEEGVRCFDAYKEEYFTLRAVLLWTINDFPAYDYNMEKNVYIEHRKYLPRHHPYRLQKKNFDDKQEHGNPPQPLLGEAIYFKLKEMIFSCGKKCGKNNNEGGNDYWKRRSSFFKLPYYKNLHVRHCLDVMHIEKNVCMNIVGTLLDISGKSKDGMNSRLDLVEMNIRPELAPMVIELDALQEDIVMTLCNLEKNRPEGCIAEAQVCEEAVQFCSDFLSGLDPIGLGSLNSRKDKQIDRPLSAETYVRPDIEHMNHLKIENPRRAKNEQWLQVEHNRSFGAWIRDKVMCELHEGKVVSNTIRWLAHDPNCGVMTYEGYMVNGCSYHTKSLDDHRTVQNSGIMLVATTMQVSSAKDKNPVIGDMFFYGIIEDIWEVSYNTFSSVLFKCKWVENKTGVRTDDLHFTLVDLSRIGHSSDAFIIATRKTSLYVSDLVDPRWSVVIMPLQKDFSYKCANDDLGDMLPHYPPVSKWNSTSDIDESWDTYTRLDCEGTWDKANWKYEPYCYEANLFHVHDDVATPKEKGESSTQKRKCGPTEMKEITRARSEGKKLVIQYNELGQAIGQNATKLKSFIGTTVRFDVPITYSDWPMVPKEIKDKIFELIEAGFVVDPRSKKTIIQNAGVCFRQFKYRLTTTYVLPFLDDVEKLKFSPNEYSFIDQQHWTEFVASRLKEDFKKKNENGKEKPKKHKYNHRTSRKGYANLMEELNELVATQNTTNAFGDGDIITRALGGKDRPGILRGVGKYVTKKKYFHTATQQKANKKEDEKATSKEHDQMAKRIKELEEELLKMKKKDDCVGDLKEESGMSSKEKSSMEGAENVNIVKDDEEVEGVTLDKMKVGTPCKLAFETKDRVVAWGTIIDSNIEGDNVKVAVDVVVDGDCAISIPSEQGMYKMSQEVGSHILWPRDLVITNNVKMDYEEFTKDMSTFAPIPIQNAQVALWYLYTRMESLRTLNLYKFVDAGSISCGSSKEERAQLLTARLLGTDYDQLLLIPYNSGNHWTLVVINLTKGAAFWIDPLKNCIDPDVTEVVERSFNLMNKKNPNWRVMKCPKQSGVLECGCYVMRFMRDIIMSTSTSIIQIMKDSPRAYTQDDIDCIRSEWAEFVGKHVH